MVMSVYPGTFQSGTGAAASTVAVTGVGFQPKAIIFFFGGQATINTASDATARLCQGFAVDKTAGGIYNAGVFGFDLDNSATSAAQHLISKTRCIEILSTGSTSIGALSVTAFGADGFTVTIAQQFTADRLIGFYAIGGSDISLAYGSDSTIPTTATTKAITGVGGVPDVVFMLGGGFLTAFDTYTNDVNNYFGVADRVGATNLVWAGESDTGTGTAQTMHYCRRGNSLASFANTIATTSMLGTVSSFDADGFTISLSEANGSADIFAYFILKGGQYKVGGTTTPTDTVTTTAIAGVGFTPRGGLTLGSEGAENSSDTPTDDNVVSMGGFNSTLQVIVGFESFDGVGTMDCTVFASDVEIYAGVNSSGAFDQKTFLVSIDADGFSYKNSLNSSSVASFFGYVLFGNDATAVSDNVYTSVYGSW